MNDDIIKDDEGFDPNKNVTFERRTLKYDEWSALGEKLYGKDRKNWKFRCPRCGGVQDAHDFIQREVRNWDQTVFFSCIGRWDGNHGCDWTLGGLFQIHRLEVITDEGKAVTVMEFADDPDAFYKNIRIMNNENEIVNPEMPEQKAERMAFPPYPSMDWDLINKDFEWRYKPGYYNCRVHQNGDFYAFVLKFNPNDKRAKEEKVKPRQLSNLGVSEWLKVVSQYYQDTLLDVKVSGGRKTIILIFSKMMNENVTFPFNGMSVTLRKLPNDPVAIRIQAAEIPGQAMYLNYRGELGDVRDTVQRLLDVLDAQLREKGNETSRILLK